MDKELKDDLQHKPKQAKIKIDKERTFILDLNAYAEIDLLYDDKNFFQIEQDFNLGRPYAIRAYLWAGLVHEDKDLTIEQVSAFIDIYNVGICTEIIDEALTDNKAEKTVEVKKDNKQAKKK